MGEYADDYIDSMIDSWAGGNGRGWGEPRVLRKKPKTCQECGAHPLYWDRHEHRWRLHHYDKATDSFTLHRCEITPNGVLIHDHSR